MDTRLPGQITSLRALLNVRKLCLHVFVGATVIAESAQRPPSFEVVSVRPCHPDEPGDGLRPASGGQRSVAKCVPIRPIIFTSFWLLPELVVGGPNWIDNDKYYVEGVAERPMSIADLHVMMQRALVERFNLKFHHQAKQLDAYVLRPDQNGPKNLREHTPRNGSDLTIEQKQEKLHEEWLVRPLQWSFLFGGSR